MCCYLYLIIVINHYIIRHPANSFYFLIIKTFQGGWNEIILGGTCTKIILGGTCTEIILGGTCTEIIFGGTCTKIFLLWFTSSDPSDQNQFLEYCPLIFIKNVLFYFYVFFYRKFVGLNVTKSSAES